ncbi:nuclear transport factor 2 family protein [Roseibium sp. HPY-6]|uniref:nuclear transport factor 2 family protein n=1 Tax=Roseibium sp. HPY-6 TaxID=3229852 RepID=UPI00338F095F
MTADDNLSALKRCYELWNETKGESVEAWLDLLDDKVDFKSLAMAQDPAIDFTKPSHGKAEVAQYLEGLKADWSMEHYTITDYVADGNTICAYGSTAWTNKKTGKHMETPKLDYIKFENGKIVFFFEFYDTASMISCACD